MGSGQQRAPEPCCLLVQAASELLVLGWRSGSPARGCWGCGSPFPLFVWGITLLSWVGAERGGGWRRFNPRDKRKPSKRLIAGLCILSGAAAHVTAAMPSARTARCPA